MNKKLPTDDRPRSVKARMVAVYNGVYPQMPGLDNMTKSEMAKELQSIWTLCDETGIQRRNETSPQTHLSLFGRVYAAIRHGTLIKPEQS